MKHAMCGTATAMQLVTMHPPQCHRIGTSLPICSVNGLQADVQRAGVA